MIHTYIYIHIYIHTYIHTYIYIYIYIYSEASSCRLLPCNMYYIYMHTYIHTYIHIYIYIEREREREREASGLACELLQALALTSSALLEACQLPSLPIISAIPNRDRAPPPISPLDLALATASSILRPAIPPTFVCGWNPQSWRSRYSIYLL
jgi:hypothetical protein